MEYGRINLIWFHVQSNLQSWNHNKRHKWCDVTIVIVLLIIRSMEFCHCILRSKLFLHSTLIAKCYIFHSCKTFIVLFHRFAVCAPFWKETEFLTLVKDVQIVPIWARVWTYLSSKLTINRPSRRPITVVNIGWFMVFNANFNNISVISWRSVLGGGNRSTRRKPPACRKSLTDVMT